MSDPAPDERALREGQTFGGSSRLAVYASFVKLPHTVFALPFALVGVLLGSREAPVTASEVAWVIVAFTAARFAAMGFNRVVDREIDARNPRTAAREIPRGALSVTEASVSVLVASLVFLLAAWQLNPLCAKLSPAALAWVLFYSYTKRFTRLAHLVLGLGLGIAPVGGYLAITGQWSTPWWLLPALSLAVMTWVGGFDVFYALPDAEFDRANRLFSIPAAVGEKRAFLVTRLLHVGTVAFLALAGVAVHAGGLYWGGVVAAAGLLAYEHSLVRPGDLRRLDAAFFTLNGVISIVFFCFVLAWRVLG